MEEVKNQPNPPAEKKKFPTLIIVIILVVLILFGGIFYATNLIKTKVANSIPGLNSNTKDSTYKVNAGNTETIVSEKEIPWPAEIPGAVQKYQGGKIKAATHDKTSNIWVIAIGNTTQLEFNNYKIYLQNANWKLDDQSNVLVNMATMTKGASKISVIFDPSSKAILITLSPIK
jgi:hypothetical protein